MKHILALLLFLSIIIFSFPSLVYAQNKEASKDETLEAVVQTILEEKQIQIEESDKLQQYQKLELLVTKGSLKDKKIIIENGKIPVANNITYKKNDAVLVTYSKDLNGKNIFYITDYIRRGSLLLLFSLFIILTIIIAKWKGVTALIGMLFSFIIIFSFILPEIANGNNPVGVAVLGAFAIIPITFFLSHGCNKKTIIAIIGTSIALIITAFLSDIFVEATKLTGFASEEAGFLQAIKPETINMKGILLAGIIIGVLGILDDITISQSAIVFQLQKANENFTTKELYQKAMNVGQDHISSMVNTLILVYTGASLPLLLLFINNPHPFFEIINYELIADEIVRTIIGSIGLILAVPITTIIASFVASKKEVK